MKYAVAPVPGHAPEHAYAGDLFFIEDVQENLIDRFAMGFIGLVYIDGKFFCRAVLDHGDLLSLSPSETRKHGNKEYRRRGR
jgi:hypothetical protein